MYNSQNNPGIIEDDSRSPLKILYIFIFISVVFYVAYIAMNFNDFSETELMFQSHFIVPAAAFSFIGMQTAKSYKSFIYAVIAAVVSLGLLMAFFDSIWASL